MNFSLLNVALFGVGALLIASAIKGKNPRDLVTESLQPVGGKKAIAPAKDDEGERGRARDNDPGRMTPIIAAP